MHALLFIMKTRSFKIWYFTKSYQHQTPFYGLYFLQNFTEYYSAEDCLGGACLYCSSMFMLFFQISQKISKDTELEFELLTIFLCLRVLGLRVLEHMVGAQKPQGDENSPQDALVFS